jgi:hypothetical protein
MALSHVEILGPTSFGRELMANQNPCLHMAIPS